MSFESKLEAGLFGEDLISKWLIRRGNQVLPAYQIQENHGKGPRLFGQYGQLICPDLLVFKGERVLWIEAKSKSAFTWHRISGTWQTGIDRRHWRDYLEVERVTPFPVWLMFLHAPGNSAKDTPDGMQCPSGLYGNSIIELESTVHHEHENHGPSGMVYWCEASLKKLATWESVSELSGSESCV
jgi:hypothetical protein